MHVAAYELEMNPHRLPGVPKLPWLCGFSSLSDIRQHVVFSGKFCRCSLWCHHFTNCPALPLFAPNRGLLQVTTDGDNRRSSDRPSLLLSAAFNHQWQSSTFSFPLRISDISDVPETFRWRRGVIVSVARTSGATRDRHGNQGFWLLNPKFHLRLVSAL